jgi:hypothetical protein
MSTNAGQRLTSRVRLEPISLALTHDLWSL